MNYSRMFRSTVLLVLLSVVGVLLAQASLAVHAQSGLINIYLPVLMRAGNAPTPPATPPPSVPPTTEPPPTTPAPATNGFFALTDT